MAKNKNKELKRKLKKCEEKEHELEERQLTIANMKKQLDETKKTKELITTS